MTASSPAPRISPRSRQTVLITGAEGAVGGYAVQLAKRRGLVVIASDLSAEGQFATEVAGADAYVPGGGDLAEAVRTLHPEGVDVVLDTATLGQAVIGAITDGGLRYHPARRHARGRARHPPAGDAGRRGRRHME